MVISILLGFPIAAILGSIFYKISFNDMSIHHPLIIGAILTAPLAVEAIAGGVSFCAKMALAANIAWCVMIVIIAEIVIVALNNFFKAWQKRDSS